MNSRGPYFATIVRLFTGIVGFIVISLGLRAFGEGDSALGSVIIVVAFAILFFGIRWAKNINRRGR
ncbi:MAG: hypothetical protein IIC60_05445 [Proteobacteria bacterium]|nr:hypothetical protein [Pseudomonadota bacterium]